MAIFGKCEIIGGAVHTHRDSYEIKGLSVVSCRRSVLAPAMLNAGGIAGFVFAFHDILYPYEIVALAVAAIVMIAVGFWLGHLSLLSRDLRGSDLSGVVYGSYRRLNKIRREIAQAMVEARGA